MTRKDEEYLLDVVEQIKDETHENNIMLKQIIKVLNYHIRNSDNDDMKDFGMNVLANIISNRFENNGNNNKHNSNNIRIF